MASRKNVPAAESKQALLVAGRKLLRERGVAPGLDRVTLKDAIAESGVPRSTAYRIFSGKGGPLESFRLAMLAELDGSVDMRACEDAVDQVLEEQADRMESGEPDQMAIALREMIRVAVRAHVDSVAANVEFKMYMSSLAASGVALTTDPDVTEMHKAAAERYSERLVPWLRDLLLRFGLRVREPMTVEEFAAVCVVTIEGVSLRQHLDQRLTSIKRTTGPNGALQVWNAAAVAIEANALVFFEANPAAESSADLTAWV